MAVIENSVQIDRSPEDVFNYLIDLSAVLALGSAPERDDEVVLSCASTIIEAGRARDYAAQESCS